MKWPVRFEIHLNDSDLSTQTASKPGDSERVYSTALERDRLVRQRDERERERLLPKL